MLCFLHWHLSVHRSSTGLQALCFLECSCRSRSSSLLQPRYLPRASTRSLFPLQILCLCPHPFDRIAARSRCHWCWRLLLPPETVSSDYSESRTEARSRVGKGLTGCFGSCSWGRAGGVGCCCWSCKWGTRPDKVCKLQVKGSGGESEVRSRASASARASEEYQRY